jgi:chromate transporter
VPAVAVQAGVGLYAHPRSRARGSSARAERRVAGRARRLAYRGRWLVYAALGAGAAAALGPYLVLVLLGCGIAELLVNGTDGTLQQGSASVGLPVPLLSVVRVGAAAGLGAVVWVAFKVGALSYGGGFVIVPLMRTDAVHTYHWMSSNQFLTAVALGQVTPGPVVATVASVGYAARGVAGGVLAAVVAFAPSFLFVLAGGGHFERLRESALAQSFLDGAGPAAIGAILGAAIPLAAALSEAWQILVLAAAALSLLVARRGIVATLLAAGFVGAVVALAGGSLPR